MPNSRKVLSESHPFLQSDCAEQYEVQQCDLCHTSFSKRNLMIHLILIFIYTAISIAVFMLHEVTSVPRFRPILPDITTKYTKLQYYQLKESPYTGPPFPSVDTAWHDLLANMSIRVTSEELAEHNLTSVALPYGGHLAWLGIYHELHCIKLMRHTNYRQQYNPGIAGKALRDLQVHVDHCSELLRASAMCRPDLETLTTFIWQEGSSGPLPSPQRPERTCVDWEVSMAGIGHRVIDDEEMGMLKNPHLIEVP